MQTSWDGVLSSHQDIAAMILCGVAVLSCLRASQLRIRIAIVPHLGCLLSLD